MNMCSGMWQPPRYGSLWTTTSPGWKKSIPSSWIVQPAAKMIEPTIDGTKSACDTRSPCRSNNTQEKSIPSLKIGE